MSGHEEGDCSRQS